MTRRLADVAIITPLSEPFLNLAESMIPRFDSLGLTAKIVFTESLLLSRTPIASGILVFANDSESWSAAASVERSGAVLLNGESRICGLERRHWKAALQHHGVRTPAWVSAASPGALMNGIGGVTFPVYLKHADSGRGLVRYFTSAGDLSEHLQMTNVDSPLLLESAVAGELEKAYMIGDSSPTFVFVDGVPTRKPELDAIGAEIQALCGLRYFSFDVIHGATDAFVIDVNRFPVYRNDSSCWDRVARDAADQVWSQSHFRGRAEGGGSHSK